MLILRLPSNDAQQVDELHCESPLKKYVPGNNKTKGNPNYFMIRFADDIVQRVNIAYNEEGAKVTTRMYVKEGIPD